MNLGNKRRGPAGTGDQRLPQETVLLNLAKPATRTCGYVTAVGEVCLAVLMTRAQLETAAETDDAAKPMNPLRRRLCHGASYSFILWSR